MTNLVRLAFLTLAMTIGFNADAGRKPAVDKDEINNVITFDEDFTYNNVEMLISEIEDSVDIGDKVIRIKFNSPGGSIFAGFKLLNKIDEYQRKGIKFIGIVDQYCMSMCFITLQHLDERLIYKYGMLLDHPASGGVNKAALIEITEMMNEKVMARLKAKGLSEVSIRQYRLLVSNEFMMNSRTALALGLVDKVISPGDENVKKVESSK